MYKLTKYCSEAENGMNGFVDNKKILAPEGDAATVNWGKKWRTPTYDEIKELLDNCEVDNVEVNGVLGKLFTSRTTGNTIFFPFTGNTGYKPGTGPFRSRMALKSTPSLSLGGKDSSLLKTSAAPSNCRTITPKHSSQNSHGNLATLPSNTPISPLLYKLLPITLPSLFFISALCRVFATFAPAINH